LKKYYIKQKLIGLLMLTIGVIMPIIDNGDATFSLLALPLGVYLVATRKRVMDFDGK
jgi:hypothetical protein